jgi:hypothetical protein
MLSSTNEYIKALRDGHFLLFLEWPKFINHKYRSDLGAEELHMILAYEWLNNGFTLDDARQFCILLAVNDMDSRPLRGDLSYALMSICSAVLQCMLYVHTNSHEHFIKSQPLTLKQAEALFSEHPLDKDKQKFSCLLQEQQKRLDDWTSAVDKVRTLEAYERITEVTGLRYWIEQYKDELSQTPIDNDGLKVTRLSVVTSFLTYLQDQTDLTSSVRVELERYVTKIRELNPAEFEEVYLNRVIPKEVALLSWGGMARLGQGFFNFLKPGGATNLIKNTGNELK